LKCISSSIRDQSDEVGLLTVESILTMAHQIVVGYSLESSEFVEINNDISSIYSGAGSNSSLGLSESSHSGTVG
jgi:hypothetical protein